MKRLSPLMLALALFAAVPPSHAEDTSCRYLNGGIGEGDQAMMRHIAKEFPLRIEFSEGEHGAFLTDIPVTIKDRHGKVVLNLPDVGPMLYVHLPKGQYTIRAVSDNVAQSGKVTLDGKHSKQVILHWKGAPGEVTREQDE
jgi:hypothetical protein